MSLIRIPILIIYALAVLPFAAPAQGNLFATVARVNDRVVTQYELDQRARFYQLLRAPGDPRKLALEKLVEERLQLDAAAALGVKVSDEEIAAGLAEFAQRANLEPEAFLAALAKDGVSKETVYDFVRAGLLWRGVVRAKFGPQVQISEAEVDRTLATGGTAGASGVRVLLSEIFLPANTPQAAAQAQQRAAEISKITTIAAFADAARKYSAAPTRTNGGRQDWILLSKLPPPLQSQIMGLSPGQVTAPIPTENAIALFQLRGIEETGAPAEKVVSIEFARLFIPGGRTSATLAQANAIAAEADNCDDLYGVASRYPDEQLMRDTLPVAQIPGDIALELARLDEGEVSTNLTTADGQALIFLMMCGRTLDVTEDADREAIRQSIFQNRMGSYAAGYLEQLKADAYIEYP